jgi:hypothetical protein
MIVTHDPTRYGESCAHYYGRIYPPPPAAMLDRLLQLAGDGSACELGLADGRVALPLAARGLRLSGIEASPAMRAALRGRDPDARVQVIAGDFANDCLMGPHALVFALVSTLALLPDAALQRRALRNIAAHLDDAGHFVYEHFEEASASPVPQHYRHPLLLDGRIETYAVTLLTLRTDQLDALAMEAGLSLVERSGDWHRHPPGRSPQRISVYRRRQDAPRCLRCAATTAAEEIA